VSAARFDLPRRLLAEALGTAFLLATVVGSGIMAERLAAGNVALALLANAIPTGAILVVLITVFGPISGAHFNPAVTLCFFMRRATARPTRWPTSLRSWLVPRPAPGARTSCSTYRY
jgi:glycerol uptake facilitator-like aquaporin